MHARMIQWRKIVPTDCGRKREGEPELGAESLLSQKRAEILRLAAKHGAYNVRVFGSVARGEEKTESDVDFLVDLEPGRSLLDLGGLLMDLQDLLGRNVEVMTEDGLHWYIRDQIIREAVPV